MTTFSNSPRLVKGGIVLLDSTTSAVRRVIPLRYNPDSLSRTLQVQGVGGEGADRLEALRLTGPAAEMITVEAVVSAIDELEQPNQGQNRVATQFGLFPRLAALETIVYPPSGQLQANNGLAEAGTLEIAPMEAPLSLFIWSRSRILPVRLTEFRVTEEAFDSMLNPIRATVNLGMRVLSVDDLGFAHKGGNLFMVHLQQKERLAAMSQGGTLSTLGITGIP